jgi:hypothetical protein
MKCHKENQSGNFFLFYPYHGVPSTLCKHRYVRFNGTGVFLSMLVIYFIMYDDVFEHIRFDTLCFS